MKYCTQCGKALLDNVERCASCGAKMAPPPAFHTYESAPESLTAPPSNFLNTGLGFIPPAMLFVVALAIGLFSPVFLAATNVSNVFRQCAFYAAVAFATVLPTRAKGPDLSIGAVMGLSGIIFGLVVQAGGSWFTGLLLAILAAAAIGAVNGVINAVIRLRSILLTVLISAVTTKAISFVVRVVALVLAGRSPIMMELPAISSGLAAFLLFLLSFMLAFFLNLGTKLGTPIYKTNRSIGLCITAYIASAIIAALTGFYLVIRLGGAMPTAGDNNELFIFFIFACIISSRALDNRIAPVLYVLFPALSWGLLSNALNLNSINSFYQSILFFMLTVMTLLIAFFSRYKKKSLRQP